MGQLCGLTAPCFDLSPLDSQALPRSASHPYSLFLGVFVSPLDLAVHLIDHQVFVCLTRPQVLSMRYTWRLANGDILDPTDANGQLPDALLGLGGLIRIPTLLALVNEPPPGVDVNLLAVISDKEVLYTAERSESHSHMSGENGGPRS